MLTEAEKVEFMDNCNKLQSLSTSQLPELIKRFDSKVNQQKDVSLVKSGEGPPKMKLRDLHEVLEIARLKVLASEMREKAAKMEAQLESEAERRNKGSTKTKLQDERKKNSKDSQADMTHNIADLRDVERINKDLKEDVPNNCADLRGGEKINNYGCMERKRDNVDIGLVDVECYRLDAHEAQNHVPNTNKNLLEKQQAQLDKEAEELHTQIRNLQNDVDKILLQLAGKPDLQKELDITKERIRGLQDEIKDDAGLTKAQLLLLKEHFGELEEIKTMNERKELEFRKARQISSVLEAEVVQLKDGNKELLKHKQELSKKLQSVLEKAEKITPVTKDDVLASEAEVSSLKSTNMELQKTVESLQISRFNEVEELVYLRWVNACLRHDLDTYKDSHRSPHDILNQSKNYSPSLHGKDEGDPMSRTNSGRSFASYSDAHDCSMSHEGTSPLYEGSTKSSPKIAITHAGTSPPSYEGSTKSSPKIAITPRNVSSVHSSPIAITPASVNSTHTSPLAVTHAHVNNMQTSPLSTIMHGHLSSSHTSHPTIIYGHVNTSHTSPQYPHQCMTTTKSGPVTGTQQHSSSSYSLSQSPEAYNPCQASPGKAAIQRDPRRISEIQSKLSFNDRSAKSDAVSYMTTFTSNSPRRSGRIFNRSASYVSSSSEVINRHTRSSPQKQDTRKFMRSSSTLSSDSDISSTSQSTNTSSLRRQSVSSGTSLLDEYLHSTDTKSLNRPTSRFSAILPYDRRVSDSASPIIEEGADLSKRRDRTYVRAHSLESRHNVSDSVVAAFQVLSASTHTNNTHRTFKDLSRQNSLDEKAASKVDDRMTDEHHSPDNSHLPSAKSTRADFFCDLARAIQATHYKSIEKVAAFVTWFDRQGDEENQEFFNFPNCPKDKVQAMRRAVYEYEELKALETELKSYQDDSKSPADLALQEMQNLLEKAENHLQGFKQAREVAVAQFLELDIPTHWMLDSEMIAKIKRASLPLAQKYIKRVTTVINALRDHQMESEKVSRDNMLLQAAKFALQIHNFAEGFDEKTANAFKVLQSQADIHESNVAYCSSVDHPFNVLKAT